MLTSERLTNHDETDITTERRCIARDLHDGVTQQFAHVLHKLEFIERLLQAQEWQSSSLQQIVLDEIRRTYALQKTGLDVLRAHIVSLLSVAGEGTGREGVINAAPTDPVGAAFMTPSLPVPSPLVALIEEFRQQNPQIELSYRDENTQHLTTALIVPIFRIVQEALNNVRKHAQASRVTVRICVLPHKCIVKIIDNGVGFEIPPATATSSTSLNTNDISTISHKTTNHNGLGLHIMRERVQEIGGKWEIYSTPGKGTTIRARFPL